MAILGNMAKRAPGERLLAECVESLEYSVRVQAGYRKTPSPMASIAPKTVR